jgi:hypothetical protein
MKSIRDEEFPELEAHIISKLEVIDRIERLENKVFKGKEKPTTLAQQILLLKKTGMLDAIANSGKKIKDGALFLSILLNADLSNIKTYLRIVPEDDNELLTPANCQKIYDTFDKSGFEKQKNEFEELVIKLKKEVTF